MRMMKSTGMSLKHGPATGHVSASFVPPSAFRVPRHSTTPHNACNMQLHAPSQLGQVRAQLGATRSWRDHGLPQGQLLVLRPVFLGGRAAQAKDALQLVCVCGTTGKQRFACVQLGQDAANRPHVDGRAVPNLSQQQLGGAIPPRDHLRTAHGVVVVCQARQPKVSELQPVVVRQQQIRALDVAVDVVTTVQVVQHRQQLSGIQLDFVVRQPGRSTQRPQCHARHPQHARRPQCQTNTIPYHTKS